MFWVLIFECCFFGIFSFSCAVVYFLLLLFVDLFLLLQLNYYLRWMKLCLPSNAREINEKVTCLLQSITYCFKRSCKEIKKLLLQLDIGGPGDHSAKLFVGHKYCYNGLLFICIIYIYILWVWNPKLINLQLGDHPQLWHVLASLCSLEIPLILKFNCPKSKTFQKMKQLVNELYDYELSGEVRSKKVKMMKKYWQWL